MNLLLAFIIAMATTIALIPPLARSAGRLRVLDAPGARKVARIEIAGQVVIAAVQVHHALAGAVYQDISSPAGPFGCKTQVQPGAIEHKSGLCSSSVCPGVSPSAGTAGDDVRYGGPHARVDDGWGGVLGARDGGA